MDSICEDRIVMMYQPEYTNAQVFPITFGHIAKPCGLAIWVTMIRYEDPEWRKSAGLDAHLPDIIDPWDSLPQWKKPDNYDIFGPLDARGRVPISAYRAGQGLFVWWRRNVLLDMSLGDAHSFRTFVLNDMKNKIDYWNTDMWADVLDVLFPKEGENDRGENNNSQGDTSSDLPE